MADAAPSTARRLITPLIRFLHAEATGGIVLLIGAVAAIVWVNVISAESYTDFWGRYLTLDIGPVHIEEDLQHWVNDALMAIFFFVVGLEIKRELVVGELRTPQTAALPAFAAFGGVIIPALLFAIIVAGGEGRAGWGIPMATDIAFAVGVLALLGRRASAGAKLFLLSVAIVDDIIAILVIAIFYSAELELQFLGLSLFGLAGVLLARAAGPRWLPWLYVPFGLLAWYGMLESGVHATLAGVALGLLMPAGTFKGRDVLDSVEHRLHPISAYLVIPIFALANAGVDLTGSALPDAMAGNVTWGVAAGLTIGKIAGISGAALLAQRWGAGLLPGDMHPKELYGVAALGGIGFTVSLFITELAYDDPALISDAKVGIFLASIVAAVIGTVLLLRAPTGTREPEVPEAASTEEEPVNVLQDPETPAQPEAVTGVVDETAAEDRDPLRDDPARRPER